MALITAIIKCSGVHCNTESAADDSWWQLDIPNMSFLAFCGLSCLRTWVMWETKKDVF